MAHLYGKSFSEFRRDNLAIPGTVIELSDGTQYLIGDINELDGACDDCLGFPQSAVVAAYHVVWQKENVEQLNITLAVLAVEAALGVLMDAGLVLRNLAPRIHAQLHSTIAAVLQKGV